MKLGPAPKKAAVSYTPVGPKPGTEKIRLGLAQNQEPCKIRVRGHRSYILAPANHVIARLSAMLRPTSSRIGEKMGSTVRKNEARDKRMPAKQGKKDTHF